MKTVVSIMASAVLSALAACAASGGPDLAAAASCEQLDADIARATQAQQAAEARSQDAWKAVVPFAVAARYARGRSAAGTASEQVEQLRGEAARRGCPGHAG